MPEHHRKKSKANELVNQKRWDEVYGREENISSVDKNVLQAVELLKERKAQEVLDLGCGSGRHVIYLALNGFDVYGIDISPKGIRKAKQRIKNRKLSAHLRIGSMYNKLPYMNELFDAVVCIRSLNHARIEDIRRAIREIWRVLVPGGLVLVTVRKRVARKKRLPHINIASRTYIPTKGREEGIIHYLFTKELLKREFADFRILELRIEDWGYYHLLAEKRK